MRDAHETGVSYGLIDIERLIHTLTIDKNNYLAVEDGGRQALENFLMARYHMYQAVYYHKTVVSFELMLQRIYEKLIEKGAYNYEQICKLSEEDFYDFNDGYVWNLLRENRKSPEHIGELITRFRKRMRLKKIIQIQGISVSGREKSEYSKLSLIENPYQMKNLSGLSGVPEDWIFYSAPKPLAILSKAEDETAIHVIKEDGESIPIAKDQDSIIYNFYDSCFLSSRVYTKDEFEPSLLKGIKDCFDV